MQALNELIPDQVSRDIDIFLKRHKDPRRGLSLLSARSQIHTKTLKRLIEKEHKPSYQTLYKLYSCLTGVTDLDLLLKAAPLSIQEKLKRSDPQLKSSASYKFTANIERELIKDPCFSELYVLAETRPFDTKYVRQRFGDYGLEVLQKMIDLKVLTILDDGLYGLGSVRSTFSADAIKTVGLRLVERFCKPFRTDENYANYMNLYFESVSEATYHQWLEIDGRAFKEKMKLLEDPQSRGPLPVFMFNAIDTLEEQ